MSFLWPQFLASLLILPALVWLYRRQQRARGLPVNVVEPQVDAPRPRRRLALARHLPASLMFGGLALLLFSLARPQMTIRAPRVEGTVILAFDVSGSMAAEDVPPNRLEAAKAAARKMVEAQPPTVRLGVVAFGGNGLVLQPPTTDQQAVLEVIERLAPEGGTSLGHGISASLNALAGRALSLEQGLEGAGAQALREAGLTPGVVVLFTDGENTDPPDPLEVAQLAAEAGVRIYTIGIGTPEGAVVEVEGFQVVSQLNEEVLQQVANLTNGAYYRGDSAQAVEEVYQAVDLRLEAPAQETEVTAAFAGLSLVLLLVAGTVSVLWFGHVP